MKFDAKLADIWLKYSQRYSEEHPIHDGTAFVDVTLMLLRHQHSVGNTVTKQPLRMDICRYIFSFVISHSISYTYTESDVFHFMCYCRSVKIPLIVTSYDHRRSNKDSMGIQFIKGQQAQASMNALESRFRLL